jgi:3-isopropylmalate/(R)-2-methylmalate dehydratase small subunit
MTPLHSLTARAVVLAADDIDTDQIIPARFLTGTSKTGLGAHLFADWRARPDFPLTAAGAAGAQILIAGNNFGCGSSREHAPWALVDFGFRAIIARSFADIFRGNAVKNGLVPIALPEAACAALEAAVRGDPACVLHVDLDAQQVGVGYRSGQPSFGFAIDPFAKHCLTTGLDELGYILSLSEQIAAYERRT